MKTAYLNVLRKSFIFCLVANLTIYAQKTLTIEKIWASAEFVPEYIQGFQMMQDGEHYILNNHGVIEKYHLKNNKKTGEIIGKDWYEKYPYLHFEEIIFSPDEKKALLAFDIEPLYRYSQLQYFWVADLENKTISLLTDTNRPKIRLAEFSPDNQKIAYVQENNLFVKNLDSGENMQITHDGEKNKIINGAPDWVYEEELTLVKAFEWSTNGNYLAFLKFDESHVKEFSMDIYGTLYPEKYSFKYPKAGEDNSIVSCFVYDLNNKKLSQINTGSEKDFYIPRIKWAGNTNKLCLIKLNRHQNKADFLLADVSGKDDLITPQTIYTEQSETFIEETYDNLQFLSDGKSFIWNSEKSGFNHLYHIQYEKGAIIPITSGDWDVIDFIGLDEKNAVIYYTSAENGPTQKHFYKVKLNGKNKTCLTPGQGYFEIHHDGGFKYFSVYHSTANQPYHIYLIDNKGKVIQDITSNENLKEKTKLYNFQPKTFFKVTNRSGIELNGWMIKPPHFDPQKKYPVFMFVYGGPGHNTVLDKWGGHDFVWHQFLAQKGFIVVSVDNRGTQYRGRDFKNSTYMNLGKLEYEDQTDVARYLMTLPYVDAQKIIIMGWSFGGYLSSICILKSNDIFAAAIAVAPVTNWRFYDTIYTERFMRTPQENPEGYDNNSPIFFADRLKGKYLIIHGTADDNVHFQNTVEMCDALIKRGKSFDMMIYPNKNHGIYGGLTRYHLFSKIYEFIKPFQPIQ